jgi:glycosyltransferase involved in cell wall biosynthesis
MAFSSRPKISIVVPSFQQGRFIGATLESLFCQNIEGLEVLVKDGGSTDGTAEILKGYGDRIRWSSGPDGGQAAAVNAGMREAQGEILGYLNSDDILYPGALQKVQEVFAAEPGLLWLYGQADYIDSDDRFVREYRTMEWNVQELYNQCFIAQPACFWRRGLWEKCGEFDESFRYMLDYDYWLRAARLGSAPRYLPEKLAGYRLHTESKSVGEKSSMREEELKMLLEHCPEGVNARVIRSVAKCRAERSGANRRGFWAAIPYCFRYWKEWWKLGRYCHPRSRGAWWRAWGSPLGLAGNL